MAIIKYNSKEIDLLARLMRAEAIGEGDRGMILVGDVGVNRVLADCDLFKDITSINKMVYQNPGGFEATKSNLFQMGANKKEKQLAMRVLRGEHYPEGANSLWFYAPKKNEECRPTWFNQNLIGRYKNHCFYNPSESMCPNVYRR